MIQVVINCFERKKKQSLLLFSHSVVSDSLWPHGLQHARLPCPAPSPGACSNSCSLSQWCHPTMSPSVIPFFCLQTFQVSGSFLISRLFASGGQNIGASASASVLLMNIQDWFPLGLTGLMSWQYKALSNLLQHHSLALSLFYCPALTSVHDYWKNHSFDNMDLCRQSNVCFLICCLGLS